MAVKKTSGKQKNRVNLDFYHSPTQLRVDTWNRLEEYTSRLAEKHMRKADIDKSSFFHKDFISNVSISHL